MAEKTYLQAISDGLRQEMRRDKRVFVLGEDVGVYGGAFKVTLGFQEEFGPWRVIDTPLSETAIVGGCHRRGDHGHAPGRRDAVRRLHLLRAGTTSSRSRPSSATAPARRCRSSSGSRRAAASPAGRSTRRTRRARSRTSRASRSSARRRRRTRRACSSRAIEDPNPVLYFEHKHLYRRIKGEVPDERYTTPFGKARMHREGDDITRRSPGARWSTPPTRPRRSSRQDGVSVEILDLRTLIPWDKEAVLESVRKTLEGARAARGHAHRRLRRRDRGDDRRGGVRGPRRAGQADRRARHARCRSRRRSRRRSSRRSRTSSRGCESSRSTRRTMATETQIEVVMPQMGVSVSEGTITKWLKQEGEAIAPTSRCSRSRPTRSTPRCRAPARASSRRSSSQEGETVEVGTVLAVIAPEGAEVPRRGRGRAARSPRPQAAPSRRPEAAADASEAAATEPRRADAPHLRRRPRRRRPTAAIGQRQARFVSPVVARIAVRARRRPERRCRAPARGGRVTKKDILAFVESGAPGCRPPHQPQAPAAPAPAPAPAAPPAPAPPPRRASGRRRAPAKPAPAPPPQAAARRRRGARADDRDAPRDRRAHAPLARHLRARDERDRGRHVEGRRDPREAEEGVPRPLRRQPDLPRRSSRARPSRRCATTRGSTARSAATRSSRATTSTSASPSSSPTARA